MSSRTSWRRALPLVLLTACGGGDTSTPSPTPVPLQMRRVADTGGAFGSERLARDPVTKQLFVLRSDGAILRLPLATAGAVPETVYTATDTGVPSPQGMAFGPDGALYLVGNEIQGKYGVATIRRGVASDATTSARDWTTLARTEPYPRSDEFDHLFNGIAVSADGRFVFVNSGARTDHGEVQTNGGRFPGLREVPLTAKIFRLPAGGRDILLRDDDAALNGAGYVFARGVRNSFDPAFSADGQLFAGDNSGDRDDNDELNWIREGGHYGFPWRMGTNDTPQQFPGYDPAADKLINHKFTAWQKGFFHDDPTYPPRPATPFTDPIPNGGPDANSFRDPTTGEIRKGSDTGLSVSTFTPHRSPLGLVFDVRNELPGTFRGSAFILGWTEGDPTGDSVAGPFLDASQDLLHLTLRRSGDSYVTGATHLVCGFQNPIDTEIVDGKLYVLELGGNGSVWEIDLPSAEASPQPACISVPR